ncbi:MAG: SMP-30/gluconolactonase/LRE family protein [Puniceicoccaceae bacterium]
MKPPILPFRPFLLLAGFLAAATAEAIRTDSHVFEGYSVLSDGGLEGAAVHWNGAVGAGPTLGAGFRPPEGSVVWDLAPGGRGSLYLATGGPGAVFRMDTRTGEMKKVLDPEAPLLRAIHVDGDGRLYAGSSPDGRIYRLSPDNGFPEIYTTLDSRYVWSIQADPADPGALLVATGAPGRIIRLPADFKAGGEPEVVVEAGAVHVSSFAHARDGTLYYATGPNGHLHRRSADGRSETLVELGAAEVREIFPGEEGSVRIAVYRSDSTGSPPSDGSGNGGNAGSGNGADASNAPEGLPSGIFAIGKDGFVEALLIGSEEKIFSAAGSRGELWIGSDTRGRLYRFADRFDWSLLAESPGGGEVSAIEPVGADSAWIATSNPASVHRLAYDPEPEGLYTSDVFDAGQKVRWGALVPAGIGLGEVEWETRSGNRSRPDESWGAWTPLDDDKVASRPGRFFQFRGRFASPAAAVRRVELFYQLPNEAPGFRRIEGLPVRLELIPTPPESPDRATLPQLFSEGGNGGNGKNARNSNGSGQQQPFVIHEERGWLSIVWEAFDPNDDELRFRVSLRRLGGEDWLLLGEDLDQPFLSLNVAGFESGYYEPRIHASDRMSNPPEMARTTEARGNLILIDNQPPKIVPPSPKRPLAFAVRDNFSIITSVSYRLEGSESRALLPRDGIFDSRRERFSLPAGAATPGATLFLEAVDARGNRAAWSGVVEEAAEKKTAEKKKAAGKKGGAGKKGKDGNPDGS